jgi:nucleoid-associated protein YgaU
MRLVAILTVVSVVSFLFLTGCEKPPPPVQNGPPIGTQAPPTGDELSGPGSIPPGTGTLPPGGSDIGPVGPVTPGDGHTYTVKAHDGLMSIARTQLGNEHRWKEILALNPEIQAPDYRLKVGQVIKMPAK